MLAEADSAWLHEVGFDATYSWPEFNMMKLIAAGKRTASAMDSVINKSDTTLAKNAIRLYFTSNHDENSWNKADFETMPGLSHAPFAVLTQTLKRSVPLIYSGQEEPVLRAISFFEKDTMRFEKFQRAGLYQKLLNLRKQNPALSAHASFARLTTGMEDKIYAYAREAGTHKVVVLLNFTNTPLNFSVKDGLLTGEATEIFSGKKEKMEPGKQFSLPAWGYQVYSY